MTNSEAASFLGGIGSVFNGTYIDPRDTEAWLRRSGQKDRPSPRKDLHCDMIAIGNIQMGEKKPEFTKVEYKIYVSKCKHDFGKTSLIKI